VSLCPPGQQRPAYRKKLDDGGLDFLGIGTMHNQEVVFVPDSQGNFIDVFQPSL
jgi:hypothetical protein